ncbi:MAG: choice-of-anchor H family protein [Ignavibacteriales bacterium]|nr:choice-of-anchor H family protein [Ignavibacteriales bacterium]
MYKKLIFLLPAFLIAISFACNTVEEINYTYSITRVWWSDSIDTNLDRYVQSKRLNFNLHLKEGVVRTVNARIYYKPREASSFTFYAFSGEQSIKGSDVDNILFVPIGNTNKELPRGIYDFKIEVYETSGTRLETGSGSSDSTILTNQPFEESANDKNYSIHTWWSNEYDRNGNSYWQNAQLNINVDLDAELQKSVFAKLYYKLASDTVYQLYNEFNDFTIFGQDIKDTVSCLIGSANKELKFGEYDFRIELFESGSNILVAYADEAMPELNNVKFEQSDLDSYLYIISNVWWTDLLDLDNDGFTQNRKLNFKVDVDKDEQRTIYAMIYYRHPDSTDYTRYDSTSNFNIFGSSGSNNYMVEIGGLKTQLDSAKYDFLISIYEPRPDSLKIVETSISAYSDSTLAIQKFEKTEQDIKGQK